MQGIRINALVLHYVKTNYGAEILNFLKEVKK